jgi:hypothetical protein
MPKQKFGTPFTMKKSPAKYYQELEMFKKFKKAAKIGMRGLLGGAAAMGTSAYGLFKGYGDLSKTKHGKEIIKQSGVGRTRKI